MDCSTNSNTDFQVWEICERDFEAIFLETEILISKMLNGLGAERDEWKDGLLWRLSSSNASPDSLPYHRHLRVLDSVRI